MDAFERRTVFHQAADLLEKHSTPAEWRAELEARDLDG